MFYLVDSLRTEAQKAASQKSSEGLLQRGDGGVRVYRSLCKIIGSWSIEMLIKEKLGISSK